MDKHELIEHLKEGHQNELDELSKLSKGELPTTNIKVGGVNVGVVNQGIQNLAKEQERKLLQDKNNLINSLKQAHLEPLCFFGDKQIERLKAANYYDLRSCDKDTGLIKLNVKQLLENEHIAGTGFHILIGFVGWIIIGFGIKSLYYEQVEPIAFFLGYALAYIVTLFCLVGLYTAIKIKQIENSVLFFYVSVRIY